VGNALGKGELQPEGVSPASGDGLATQARASWPTPTTRDHKDGGYCPNVPINGLLGRMVWPTPTAQQYGSNQGGAAGRVGPVRGSIATIAKSVWPTPTSLAQAKDGNNEAGNSAGLVANPEAFDWVIGADGKARRVKPGIRLLAHGIPARVAKLRALGNAIDLRPAAAFITAALSAIPHIRQPEDQT
jgi:hypothetical protein